MSQYLLPGLPLSSSMAVCQVNIHILHTSGADERFGDSIAGRCVLIESNEGNKVGS